MRRGVTYRGVVALTLLATSAACLWPEYQFVEDDAGAPDAVRIEASVDAAVLDGSELDAGSDAARTDAQAGDLGTPDVTDVDAAAADVSDLDVLGFDTPTADIAASDGAMADGAMADSAMADVAATDLGVPDLLGHDAAAPDLGPLERYVEDSGLDAALIDGQREDAADAARADTGATDSALPDTATPDAGEEDAAGPSFLVSAGTEVNLTVARVEETRTCGEAVNYSVAGISGASAQLSETLTDGCLAPGDEVLLINLQGASGATDSVGHYEFLHIESLSADTVTFTSSVSRYYGSETGTHLDIGTGPDQQKVMLQRVPLFTSVRVESGATLTASHWDGYRGGVLALRAMGDVTIDGALDMRGKGFRGGDRVCATIGSSGRAQQGESISGVGILGAPYIEETWPVAASANVGGGGGGCYQSPSVCGKKLAGAGASHGDLGEHVPCGGGHCCQSIYGACYLTSERGALYGHEDLRGSLHLGSGGGGGGVMVFSDSSCGVSDGGAGGGLIFVGASSLTVNGGIQADGAQADAAGSTGGGGSGGSVLLVGSTLSVGTQQVTSRGGPRASSAGASAAGGDGRICVVTGSFTGQTAPSAFQP